jgi:hypothetical protein
MRPGINKVPGRPARTLQTRLGKPKRDKKATTISEGPDISSIV